MGAVTVHQRRIFDEADMARELRLGPHRKSNEKLWSQVSMDLPLLQVVGGGGKATKNFEFMHLALQDNLAVQKVGWLGFEPALRPRPAVTSIAVAITTTSAVAAAVTIITAVAAATVATAIYPTTTRHRHQPTRPPSHHTGTTLQT